MARVSITTLLIVLSILCNAEKLTLVSLEYEITVNSKYRFLVSVNYNFDEYPNTLTSTVLAKSRKGTPPKYQLLSTTTSVYKLEEKPTLSLQNTKIIQGETEIKQTTSADKSKGIKISLLISNASNSSKYEFLTNYVECFDIPSLLYFISDKEISSLKNLTLLYNSSLTNIYLTNLLEVDMTENIRNEFVKFKKISDLTVADKFKLNNVTFALFTNVQIEGRLVDAKVTSEKVIRNKD